MDEDNDEELFCVDEVSSVIKESIETTISGSPYLNNKVSGWVNSIVETTLASLTKLQKSFKERDANIDVPRKPGWNKMSFSCKFLFSKKKISIDEL